MAKVRSQKSLMDEISQLSSGVSHDARSTILTIRNLIESNSRVEESIDALHKTINSSNQQNERLQRRIYYLTIVTVVFTLVQVIGVLVQLLK
jgi:Mg2+ and Co2+ transporter CorA